MAIDRAICLRGSAAAAAENDDVKISSWKVCSIGMPDDGLDSWIFCIYFDQPNQPATVTGNHAAFCRVLR